MVTLKKILFPTDFSANANHVPSHAISCKKHMDNYVDQQMPRILPDDTTEIRIRRVISKGKPAEEIAVMRAGLLGLEGKYLRRFA